MSISRFTCFDGTARVAARDMWCTTPTTTTTTVPRVPSRYTSDIYIRTMISWEVTRLWCVVLYYALRKRMSAQSLGHVGSVTRALVAVSVAQENSNLLTVVRCERQPTVRAWLTRPRQWLPSYRNSQARSSSGTPSSNQGWALRCGMGTKGQTIPGVVFAPLRRTIDSL